MQRKLSGWWEFSPPQMTKTGALAFAKLKQGRVVQLVALPERRPLAKLALEAIRLGWPPEAVGWRPEVALRIRL